MSGNNNILVLKHFHRLQRNQNQVQVHVPQQPSQPVPLNMVLYRKAVHGVLWVQLALVVSCLPYFIAATVLSKERDLILPNLSLFYTAVSLVYFYSSLNPFLYFWKISEVIIVKFYWQHHDQLLTNFKKPFLKAILGKTCFLTGCNKRWSGNNSTSKLFSWSRKTNRNFYTTAMRSRMSRWNTQANNNSLNINIFLSITAFLSNSLILVALHKESSLHSPFKLMYRCLATTDLCVGPFTEPYLCF